ncbi:MAG: hypothetical protein GIKADHBN_00242 [Phycisphaerales bacterium]|nr:hypothetical protein [Phycisphaerales bacterium]
MIRLSRSTPSLFVTALVIVCFPMATAIGQPSSGAGFRGLGGLPGGGSSSAVAVTSSNLTVVGEAIGPNGPEAFLWRPSTGMIGLGDLIGGDFNSRALSVASGGNIVVGDGRSVNGKEAFVWTSASGMVGLGDLPGGGFWSGANSVSRDGRTIVGYGRTTDDSQLEAFVWTEAGGMVSIGDLPGSTSAGIAYDVSGSGSVVVGSGRNAAGRTEPFRWTAGTGMIGLGYPNFPSVYSSTANAVSDDGRVVAGFATASGGVLLAWRWTATTGMQLLSDLSGGVNRAYASDVSADGYVTAGYSDGGNGEEAVIWTPHLGVRPLKSLLQSFNVNLEGWTLRAAWGVSEDGRYIVGSGLNPSGEFESWLATLPKSILLRATTATTAYPHATLRGVGDLPGGQFASSAAGLSPDGRYVCGSSASANGDEGFVWHQGAMTGMGIPPGRVRTTASDVVVVAGLPKAVGLAFDGFSYVGVMWTPLEGITQLQDLPGGAGAHFAEDISHDGSRIIGSAQASAFEPTLWTNGTPVALGLLAGADYGGGIAISADGNTAVGHMIDESGPPGLFRSFRWTSTGGLSELGPMPGYSETLANGVSSDGLVVVGYAINSPAGDFVAFRWAQSGGFQSLGHLAGAARPQSSAHAVSSSGGVVVGSGRNAGDQYEAVVWTPTTGMVSLRSYLAARGANVTGWTLTAATDISDDGSVICGEGINPAGNSEGWVATLIEP